MVDDELRENQEQKLLWLYSYIEERNLQLKQSPYLKLGLTNKINFV